MIKSWIDSIVYNMTSSMESNWVTELETLQCLGEEITPLLTMYVIYALSSLDPTKSSGCDNIGPKLLKHCASALYIPLHHLFSVDTTVSW